MLQINNRLHVITFLLMIVVFLSCSNSNDNNLITERNKELEPKYGTSNYDSTSSWDKPIKHYCPEIADCQFPAMDCFAEVVVTAEREIYINEIDQRIENNSLDDFFAEDGNYNFIFTGLYGPALYDLRNGVTTLRKIISSNGNPQYYIVFTNDTTSRPDYSNDY